MSNPRATQLYECLIMESPIRPSLLVLLQISWPKEVPLTSHTLPAEEGIQAMPETVRIFYEDTPRFDDITSMMIRSR
ncbi:MAG TPA: hypothetical protein PKJ91_01445 [Methanoregulaceae archaeon]|nr:hypothetical protein [Methanoregulaceae archaeon]